MINQRPPKRAAVLPDDRPIERLTPADREKVMRSVDAFIAWACARKGLQAPTLAMEEKTKEGSGVE